MQAVKLGELFNQKKNAEEIAFYAQNIHVAIHSIAGKHQLCFYWRKYLRTLFLSLYFIPPFYLLLCHSCARASHARLAHSRRRHCSGFVYKHNCSPSQPILMGHTRNNIFAIDVCAVCHIVSYLLR